MARIHAKDAVLLVDEFDFSDMIMSTDLNVDNSVGEVTAFADTDATFVEGRTSWTMDVNGLWSTSSPNYDGEMFTDLTAADRLLSLYPGGATVGNRGYMGRANISTSPRTSDLGSAIGVGVTWRGDKALARSHLSAVSSLSGNGTTNGTVIQIGATSAAQQMVSFLHVTASGGDGSQRLNITIQSDSSSGMSSPTTRITHTEVAGSATSEIKTDAGAVTDDYWRAVMVVTSSGGSPTFTVRLGLGITLLEA